MSLGSKYFRRMAAACLCAGLLSLGAGCALGETSADDSRIEVEDLIEDLSEVSVVTVDVQEDETEAANYEGLPIGRTLVGLGQESGNETVLEEELSEADLPWYTEPEEDEESTEEELSQQMQAIFDAMTLEEEVAQMFIITPEALTGVDTVSVAGETSREALANTPVGGLIYTEKNLYDRDQITSLISGVQAYSMESIGLPLLICVDEEGGSVLRIGGRVSGIEAIASMADYGADGDVEAVRLAGETVGTYLAALGFNCDLAPVADVLSNPENTVVADRSFGSDPELTARMAVSFAQGLEAEGVIAAYKHFPGHGATAEDSHSGYAHTDKTLEELEEEDLVPFQAAVDAGAEMIMVGHIALPSVTGNEEPATLSEEIITGLLREQMGYEGLVITDALDMTAVTSRYDSASAAVKAVQAGADLLLMPSDFDSAYRAVIEAVEDGTISADQIDASVKRILRVKQRIAGEDTAAVDDGEPDGETGEEQTE